MHEAIIAISKNTVDAPDKVGFMVSKSTTAPVFNTIKDKNTFYTRDLVIDTPLNVYLSVTDKTPETAGDFDTVAGVRASSVKLNNPEQFLEKDTEYTLYVYQLPNGEVVKTEKFTTIGYPTDAENGFYGTPKTVHTIGMKVSEKFMTGLLGKGFSSSIETNVSVHTILFCEINIGLACLVSAEGTTNFVQQKPNNTQYQEMLIYIENNNYFGIWQIRDAGHSTQTVFTLTEIE